MRIKISVINMSSLCAFITIAILLSMGIVYVTKNISNNHHQAEIQEYMNTNRVMRNELEKARDKVNEANGKISNLEKENEKIAQSLKSAQSKFNQVSDELKIGNIKISSLEDQLKKETDDDAKNKIELTEKIQQAEKLIADLKMVILSNNITLNG